jgi:hypothetical protein
MLKEIDRIQIATENADAAAAGWTQLLGAELHGTDRVHALAAKRTTYRLGRGEIEFLEPDGAGPIQKALQKRGRAHLYAAGASTDDLDLLLGRLRSRGLEPAVEGGQAFLDAGGVLGVDFPLVLSAAKTRVRVGLVDFLYEVTLLAEDVAAIVSRMAALFELRTSSFTSIASKEFGYSGILTLFSAENLHRFEVIHPSSDQTTMGRFFKRHGASFYMAFAEAPDLSLIEQRAAALGAGITADRPPGRPAAQSADQMWLHASAMGGVMIGLSRPTMAWKWSGHPERVRGIE